MPAPLIEDIEHRLDKTIELYQQQKQRGASEVQAAYFEVFENLEGPIRINFRRAKATKWRALSVTSVA